MPGRAARSSLTPCRRTFHRPCRDSNETARPQRAGRARPGAPDARGGARARSARDAAVALAVVLLLWIWQYRSTRQRIHPVDTFGGVTTEMARPATMFFILLAVGLAAFAVALIVGHIVWGQKF